MVREGFISAAAAKKRYGMTKSRLLQCYGQGLLSLFECAALHN